jgi:serine protease Do
LAQINCTSLLRRRGSASGNVANTLLDGSPRVKGVAVTDVAPDSEAAAAGLRRGDVIEEVNREPVESVSEYRRAVRRAGNQSLVCS